MSDYGKLVEELRETATFTKLNDLLSKREQKLENLAFDAAAAIEALNRLVDLNTQRCEELRKQLRETHESYERHLNELEAQLPKLGEWVLQASGQDCKCSVCESYWIPFGDEYDYKFCPNCGAKMNDSNASNALNALNALDNAQDGPIITPCRGCSDYDGYGGCKSKGGCARAKMEVQE